MIVHPHLPKKTKIKKKKVNINLKTIKKAKINIHLIQKINITKKKN